MGNSVQPVGIVGTGAYLPEKVLTNADLERMVETSDEWIRTRTGIVERRVLEPELAASDMALAAGNKALANAGVAPEEIDLIIVATVTPDMMFPSTASLVQDRLGARRAAAFDMEAGCTGYVYALTVAKQFIAAGTYRTVLVIASEILTRITNWADRNTCVLFGDGAGAAVLRPVPEGYGILSTVLGSDGSGGPFLNLPAGGSRLPASPDTIASKQHTIHMNGSEVYKFAVRAMEDMALQALRKCGLSCDDITLLIPHQANYRIVDAAIKRLGLPKEKVYINLDRYGNMSSASMAVGLHDALQSGRIRKGDIIVLAAFGAGLTMGGGVIRWWE